MKVYLKFDRVDVKNRLYERHFVRGKQERVLKEH